MLDFEKYIEAIRLQPQAAESFRKLHNRSGDPAFESRVAEAISPMIRVMKYMGSIWQSSLPKKAPLRKK